MSSPASRDSASSRVMTQREFLDRVLLPLGRLTAEERENVRRELEEHIEDRMEEVHQLLGLHLIQHGGNLRAQGPNHQAVPGVKQNLHAQHRLDVRIAGPGGPERRADLFALR